MQWVTDVNIHTLHRKAEINQNIAIRWMSIILAACPVMIMGCSVSDSACPAPSWSIVQEVPETPVLDTSSTYDLTKWSTLGYISESPTTDVPTVWIESRVDELILFFIGTTEAIGMSGRSDAGHFISVAPTMGRRENLSCWETPPLPTSGAYVLESAQDHGAPVEDLSTLPIRNPILTISGASLEISYRDPEGTPLHVQYIITPYDTGT